MADKTFIILLFILTTALSVFAEENIELQNDVMKTFGILRQEMKSKENPIISTKVKLGRMLFYDTRLSVDNTVSCAKCHFFRLYGIDGLPKSIGNNYKENDRNAPTVFNAAGQISQHWIGDSAFVDC